MLLLHYLFSFSLKHTLLFHGHSMLNFVYNFLSFLLVFLVNSHALFETGSHTFLRLGRWIFFFILFNRFSSLFFVFVYKLFGILTYKSLIILIVLLFLLLSFDNSSRNWLRGILLQRYFIYDLSNLRVTEFTSF